MSRNQRSSAADFGNDTSAQTDRAEEAAKMETLLVLSEAISELKEVLDHVGGRRPAGVDQSPGAE